MTRLAVFALLVAGCGGGASEPATNPAPEVVDEAPAAPMTAAMPTGRGAEVFATHCAVCHGEDAMGNGPGAAALDPKPAALQGPRAQHLRGIPRRQIIEEGSPGTAMVGWKAILTPEDLDAVYEFVHELNHGPTGGAGGSP